MAHTINPIHKVASISLPLKAIHFQVNDFLSVAKTWKLKHFVILTVAWQLSKFVDSKKPHWRKHESSEQFCFLDLSGQVVSAHCAGSRPMTELQVRRALTEAN